jgi:hypothetical protein
MGGVWVGVNIMWVDVERHQTQGGKGRRIHWQEYTHVKNMTKGKPPTFTK